MQMIPEEGKYYDFSVAGEVLLPDGQRYYRLRDPNGFQHLLDTETYRRYNFQEGTTVSCQISRINCNGKIYIEPAHPVYIPGNKYEFPVTAVEEKTSSEAESAVFLVDVFGNSLRLPSEGFDEPVTPGMRVVCLVERIKNGIPQLMPPVFHQSLDALHPGTEYRFKVGKIIYGGKRDEYYLLHREENKFRIKRKYFRSYGFSTGDTITCRIVMQNGIPYPEPNNPLYTPGSTYHFDIIGEDIFQTYPEGTREMLILKNPTGKEIITEKPTGFEPGSNPTIPCRVIEINRGEPVLQCG